MKATLSALFDFITTYLLDPVCLSGLDPHITTHPVGNETDLRTKKLPSKKLNSAEGFVKPLPERGKSTRQIKTTKQHHQSRHYKNWLANSYFKDAYDSYKEGCNNKFFYKHYADNFHNSYTKNISVIFTAVLLVLCSLLCTCDGCYAFPPGVRDPCLDERCAFGAQCYVSLDGGSARCQVCINLSI